MALRRTAHNQLHDRVDRMRAFRDVLQMALDAFAWSVGLVVFALLRFDFDLGDVHWAPVLAFVPVTIALQFATGRAFGLYIGRYRLGSFEQGVALVRSVLVVTPVLFVLNVIIGRPLPLSVPLAAGVGAVSLMGAGRAVGRALLDARMRPKTHAHPLLVFGAGEGAHQIVTAMLRDPDSPYRPVALLDDHPSKRNRRILGVPVVGGREDMAQAARDHSCDTLLIALPSIDAENLRRLTADAEAAGLAVKILPRTSELFDHTVAVGDIRTPTIADLLGRQQIDTDVASIAGYVTNKRVLVTGAGGSIGSELCRQLHRFAPAELFMLDRDESALHAVQMSIEGRALLDTPNLVLADIRDTRRLAQVFEETRPDVVFHAAALKHLTLLESNPGEAVQTNVWGTLNVLRAAKEAGVDRFVNISTDKAADPCCVLGYSKRITERLTAAFAQGDQPYLSVRFGNVLGSRGSVLGAFKAQIEAGGPVTVTHPDVTRYFMTVEEAVQLVIQAGAIGRSGEVLVLDMGEPVRILDVAERMVAESERPVEIVFTGLRAGEKLHEDLLATGEIDDRPIHSHISQVPVLPLPISAAYELQPTAKDDELFATFIELCVADRSADDLVIDLTTNPNRRSSDRRQSAPQR